MKIIKTLSDMIEDEIKGADEYITEALKLQYENRPLADLLYDLSTQEMGHMQTLHGQVAEIIQDYRQKHGEPPDGMKVLYDILHEQHISNAAAVKAKQDLYRSN